MRLRDRGNTTRYVRRRSSHTGWVESDSGCVGREVNDDLVWQETCGGLGSVLSRVRNAGLRRPFVSGDRVGVRGQQADAGSVATVF